MARRFKRRFKRRFRKRGQRRSKRFSRRRGYGRRKGRKFFKAFKRGDLINLRCRFELTPWQAGGIPPANVTPPPAWLAPGINTLGIAFRLNDVAAWDETTIGQFREYKVSGFSVEFSPSQNVNTVIPDVDNYPNVKNQGFGELLTLVDRDAGNGVFNTSTNTYGGYTTVSQFYANRNVKRHAGNRHVKVYCKAPNVWVTNNVDGIELNPAQSSVGFVNLRNRWLAVRGYNTGPSAYEFDQTVHGAVYALYNPPQCGQDIYGNPVWSTQTYNLYMTVYIKCRGRIGYT